MLATKERIVARRQFATERYILSTLPVLYIPLGKKDHGESGKSFISSDGIGHLATVTGATWGIQGRTFDGTDDYLTFGLITQTGINDIAQATMETWIKTPVLAATTQYSIITHRRKTPSVVDNWQFVIWDKNALASVWIGGVEKAVQGATTLLDNTWYHIVAVKTAANLSIFLNTISDQTPTAAVGNIDNGNASWDIGCAWGNNAVDRGVFYKNIIGEILLYNRALSALEIQRHYLATRWQYQ